MPKDTGKKLADMLYGQNPEQAAFGFFPQMRPRRTQQDPEAAKNVPVDLARGFVAGVAGVPGEIEAFGRLPYELITGKESPTILPTSADIEKRLPFGSDTPVGRAASGLGTLAGSFYTGAGSVPRAFGNVVRDVSGAISKARQPKAMPEIKIPDLPPSVTEPIEVKSIPAPYRTEQPQGLSYETRQEGSFYRVKPNLPEATARQDRGTKEGVGGAPAFIRSTGSDVPQPVTDEAVQAVMAKPDNFVRQVADEYSQKNTGEPYQLPEIPESSLLKQSPIGRVFDLAATDDPAYKKTVFDAYAKQYPKLVEQSGAQNYDQLMEASYRQLAKETEQQFRALPINMSYHRAGEGNYENSKELLRDIYGNRHMYVYQGGDPHDFLNAVDPATGLNTNEMFRAVHDFFGHAIHGNQFGPKGEEIAWAAHSKMFSPLARLAMTSETRGQNSFVNYTPLNAELKRNINELNGQLYEAKRRGNKAMVDEINKDLAEVWQGFQFAPQKSVILPPEFLDLKYSGGMPQYLQPLIKPKAGTTVASELTHFSPKEGLSTIDPRMFGAGIKGEELQRLQGQPGAVMERSYFYTGDPTKATPEPGLGPYRYLGESSSLYDVAADPLKLRTLAAETQRTPYTSPVNPGMVTGSPFTDVERMVKEYGYEGLVNPTLTKPSAIMFKPTPVRPFKKGGAVHISDNPDVMQLELAKGGAVAALKSMLKGAKAAPEKPAFTEKQVQITAEKMADKIKAENPKLSDDEAMKKALRQAEQKLKWEKVEKPALEKTYGPLEKAKFSAPLSQRQRNVPEVVQQRIQETRDFLSQPVEPWQPPSKELQAFERERIKDALEGFPGVEQTRFPRYQPARADLGYVEEVYDDPVNRELIKGQITRGLPLGGETFYASLYPLKLAALERGIPEKQFNQFIYSVAPASARNSIMNEMAVGQFLRDMKARGLPLDEATVSKEMAAFKEKYGTGLPLMPVHREGVKNVLEGEQDLRELLKADIPTNYKIPTYGTQKAGDFGKSMVLDVHESAGQTRGSKYHPYFTEQGGFGPTEYGLAESKMLDIAEEMGIPGGMAQAGRWFGGGELTGLKSPRGDALDLLERQAAYTMQGIGIKPTPSNIRKYILDMMESGEGVLMPWYKKEGMPDLRTKKKKGGAVRKAAGGEITADDLILEERKL